MANSQYDFSKMSDEELSAIAMGDSPKAPSADVSKMSDVELEQIAAGKVPVPQKALEPPSNGNTFGPGGDVSRWMNKNPKVKGYVRGGLESLPLAGGLAGGLVGNVGTPVGAVIGAGVGGAAGKSAENFGKQWLLGEDIGVKQAVTEPINTGAWTAAGQASAPLLEKGFQAVANTARLVPKAGRWVIEKALPSEVKTIANVGASDVAHANAVKAAGDTLGITPTKGMLSTNTSLRGLESSLEQSPSIAGSIVQKEVDAARAGMSQVVENATASRTVKTAEQIGDAIKDGIRRKVTMTNEPIKQIYAEFEKNAQNIPLKDKSLKQIVGNITRYADETLAGPSQALVKGYADTISRAKSVDQLKLIRTNVLAEIRSGGPGAKALDPVVGKLDRAIESNILRASLEVAKESGLKGKAKSEIASAGKELVGSFKTVSKDYREFKQGLESVAETAKLGKLRGGPAEFLEMLDDVPSSQLGDKLFRENNVKFLGQIKKQFPQEFEQIRQMKLADIYKETLVKTPEGREAVNPERFLKAINRLEPEVRQIIFGPEFKKEMTSEQAFNALKTLTTSMPFKAGPSGTPQGMQLLGIATQPKQELSEAARLAYYRKFPSPLQPPAQQMDALTKNISLVKTPTFAGEASSQALQKRVEGGPMNRRMNRLRSTNKGRSSINE